MTEPATDARTTPLHDRHVEAGATLVDFAGWRMPLRYHSESDEHRAVRGAAGLFDLSHMGEISVTGPQSPEMLDHALIGHLSTVPSGRARYTMLTDEGGGVLDDLVVYRTAEKEYLVVANAANVDTVAEALSRRASGFDVRVSDDSADFALIAVQGPFSEKVLSGLTDTDLTALRYYAGHPAVVAGQPVLLARTGYTGEDGFELFARQSEGADASALWSALLDAGRPEGILPAGLSARDTLRLEAGMPLYGNELSTAVTPFEAGLGRLVKLEKPGDFVGRAALAARAERGPEHVLVGLVGRGRRVPRHGYRVLREGSEVGTVTSGAPSPTLGAPIVMAYVAAEAAEGPLSVDVRGRSEDVDVVPLPFYRRER